MTVAPATLALDRPVPAPGTDAAIIELASALVVSGLVEAALHDACSSARGFTRG